MSDPPPPNIGGDKGGGTEDKNYGELFPEEGADGVGLDSTHKKVRDCDDEDTPNKGNGHEDNSYEKEKSHDGTTSGDVQQAAKGLASLSKSAKRRNRTLKGQQTKSRRNPPKLPLSRAKSAKNKGTKQAKKQVRLFWHMTQPLKQDLMKQWQVSLLSIRNLPRTLRIARKPFLHCVMRYTKLVMIIALKNLLAKCWRI